MDSLNQYDFLVNTHTEHLLNQITHDIGDEEVAIHVTILAFEKLWYHLEEHDYPMDVEQWLVLEAKRFYAK
ncbi:hypothetical protein QNZ93_004154 [Vibrio parahaemolyticus]|nr:hypothetical protein [Vibrio parahaemolyticus]ELB2147287.1 hypothetical protein [Vibrio parahaemolyticus]ELB2239293.1 hypothetical protein [Vibrio parahaemolyticus]